MPRTAKKITIEGQYAEGVLGTFRIIRGFATLQDLAEISAPFAVYQLRTQCFAAQPRFLGQEEKFIVLLRFPEHFPPNGVNGSPLFLVQIHHEIQLWSNNLPAQPLAITISHLAHECA